MHRVTNRVLSYVGARVDTEVGVACHDSRHLAVALTFQAGRSVRGFRRHKHLLFYWAAPTANEATRRQYTCRHVTGLPRKQRRAKPNMEVGSGRSRGR